LPDFSWYRIPKREKIPKMAKNIPKMTKNIPKMTKNIPKMTKNIPNDDEVDQTAVK
jgi:hypothetical protein